MGTKAAIDESSPRVVVKARRARTTPFTNDGGMNTDCIRRRTRILNIPPHISAAAGGLLRAVAAAAAAACLPYYFTLLYLLPAPLCSSATNTARPAVAPRFPVS